jgi:dihydrofolate synthase/folylpolyglutamate synthase
MNDPLDWLYHQSRRGAPRGLERIQVLLEALGHPERTFQAVHVLGTNGKGSVVAFLEAILRAAGRPYGSTISPHLIRLEERICTHRGEISREEVLSFLSTVQTLTLEPAPAFFDLVTALAFLHFARAQVPLALVEAGVGGLNDATNVLPHVALTVITNIGEDHLEVLGGSLEAVAREKAGAIRFKTPVLTQAEGLGLEVIRAVASDRQAPLYTEGPLFELPVEPNLPGRFQRTNAALAAAAARLLGVPEAAIAQGLRSAHHPGRLQRLNYRGAELILDGAHNPPAARALAQELKGYHLIYGGFPRKDYRAVLAALLPQALSVRYTLAGEGGLEAAALQAVRPAPFFQEPSGALDEALKALPPAPILVTGSLYLVGAVLQRIESS